MCGNIVPQSLVARTRRRKIYRCRLPFRRFFFDRAAGLAVFTLGSGAFILRRIASRRQDGRVRSIFGSTLVKDPARSDHVSQRDRTVWLLLCLPDSANMWVALKDLNIQPSFPEMDGSSHATDTCANDADGLDVEALITHYSGRCLARCMLYRCDRERSKKRERELSRRTKETNASKNNECDGDAI